MVEKKHIRIVLGHNKGRAPADKALLRRHHFIPGLIVYGVRINKQRCHTIHFNLHFFFCPWRANRCAGWWRLIALRVAVKLCLDSLPQCHGIDFS